ncbi:ribosome silencing factor RsfS/YbeB/iojap [Bradyrhizobium sp. LB1.3]
MKAQPDADKTLSLILSRLDDMKAEETVTIDLRGKSAYSDYMIVTTGRANRHVGAIAENVAKGLKENGIKNIHVEGLPNCDWVLIDSGDVIVHVFRPRGPRVLQSREIVHTGPRGGEGDLEALADFESADAHASVVRAQFACGLENATLKLSCVLLSLRWAG